MRNELLVTGLGMVFPLLGVALSWWSFRWAEDGATPDAYYDPTPESSPENEILAHGIRERARMCARVTFALGALLIAAGVPMGAAAQHTRDSINGFALTAYALVLFGVAYCVRQIVAIWISRRASAFSWYYDNNAMPYQYDRDRTAKIFFALNPTPIWALPDRRWFDKLRKPNIDDVVRLASNPPAEVIAGNHPAQVPAEFAPPPPES
jgi:hypothetical protein